MNFDAEHIRNLMNHEKVRIKPKGGSQMQENYSHNSMGEKEMPDLSAKFREKYSNGSAGAATVSRQPQQINENLDENAYKQKVNNSNLPDHIKKIMIENRVDDPTEMPIQGFPKSMHVPKKQQPRQQQIPQQPRQQVPQTPSRVNESKGDFEQSIPNISRDQMKSLMKEMLGELYLESLTESKVRSTIKKIINENKTKNGNKLNS